MDPADCQALADIADLSTAVLRQQDMLGAFQQVAIPKLNTWVVARVTDSTSQARSGATTPTATTSAVVSNTSVQPAAEHDASAVAPASDAAATTLAQADGVEVLTGSASRGMPSEAGGSNRIPQGVGDDKQVAQVRLLVPFAPN